MGLLYGPRRALLGGKKLRPFDFDLGALTFVAGMAKRAGGTFAGAPIVQGKWDSTSVCDTVMFGATEIFGDFYNTLDSMQGTISFWITPEWDGNDGLYHGILFNRNLQITKNNANRLVVFVASGPSAFISTAAWTAGTTYHVVIRWDLKKTLDGTNYICISINGSHTFRATSVGVSWTPLATTQFGYQEILGNARQVNAIIEGLRIDRRVWYEATSGTGEPYYFTNTGYADEIAAAYAAGAGADPALVEASWDGCMCLPTDSAVGALVTGPGEAWSHPHASALLNNTWLEDTFGPNQQDYLDFVGTGEIDCGSAAALDNLLTAQDATVGFWAKIDNVSSGSQHITGKFDGSDGWYIALGTDIFFAYVVTDGTDGQSRISISTTDYADGKWHYFAVYYDDAGDRKFYFAIDGKWVPSYVVQTASTGNISDDSALSYTHAANDGGTRPYNNELGHVSIWSDEHDTVGTDFIPPRTKPGAGGTLVESWGLDDGTGATAAATVTSPGNDGTIANGTWTEKWEFTGTPLELTSLEFDGDATGIDYGSGANIDDLHAGNFTIDILCRPDGLGEGGAGTIISKTDAGLSVGWRLLTVSPNRFLFRVYCDTNIANVYTDNVIEFGKWYHIRATYDGGGGTKTPTIYLNGVEAGDGSTQQGLGAETSDAAVNCISGNSTGGTRGFDGALGWLRLSNNIRGTADYLPNTRVNPPGNDANAHLLINMDEGAGATAADTSGNAYDGTITFGAGQWRNTFAQEYDAPGERTYAWGYSIGSDGALDGVEQHLAVTAGDDHVLRIPVRYEDAIPQAQILVYDETGAAAISTFDGPPLTGLHSGANNSAVLVVAGEFFPASLIDGVVYNITDGSSGTITAVGGTNQDTITATLDGGGVDDDWDTNDVFMIVPPANWVWAEPFCVEMPAGCTEASVQLLNAAGDGVLHWQQAEVQTNLVDNGGMEGVYAGVPPIPPGWVNAGLDAGDTQAEAVIIHSGIESMEWNPGAIESEGIYQNPGGGLAANKFYSWGFHMVGDGTATLEMQFGTVAQALLQYSSTDNNLNGQTAAVWENHSGVWRVMQVGANIVLYGFSGAVGGRFTDDVYVIECDNVSLTVTPASEANSLEGTGIRIDGRDTCTQVPTVGILKATRGWIRFRWRPRHSAAQAVAFGETGITTDIFDGRAPIANAIQLYWAAANMIQLIVDDGGPLGIVWNATGLVVADTEYLVEIRYYPARADLLIDGVIVATGAAAIDFGADIITLANYGHNNVNADQTDAVFSAP